MKKVTASLISGLAFLCLLSCCGFPIPVADPNYKDSVTYYSWYEFDNKVFIAGGEYWKAVSKKYNWNLFGGSGFDYNYISFPNNNIYVRPDDGELAFYLSLDSFSFNWINLSEWGLEKCGRMPEELDLNRYNRYFVEYKDKIWIVGGQNVMDWDLKYGDVLVSNDGVHWKTVLTDAPWAYGTFRSDHHLFVWKDRLWLLGGYTEDGRICEIWVTADGRSWTQTAVLPELQDIGNIYTFQGDLYFRGKKKKDSRWYTFASKDGAAWEQIDDMWNRGNYNDTLYFEFDGRLYSATSSGLWVSEDARSWKELFNNVDFSNDLQIRNGEVWMTGPFLLDYRIAVSQDLTTWQLRGEDISFDFLPAATVPYNDDFEYDYEIEEFRNSLWILTGHPEGVWRSADGLEWEQVSDGGNAAWPPRSESSCFVFRDHLWMTGGRQKHTVVLGDQSDEVYSVLNDVLYTEDGKNWKTALQEAPWPRRWAMKTVVWSNNLYMIGGESYGHDYYEIWKSTDGSAWEKTVNYYDLYEGAEIRPGFLNAIVFKNKLYIFDAYLTGGCLAGSKNGEWEYMKIQNSVPDLDNIVIVRTGKGEEILICKEDEEFYFSVDFLNWTPLEIINGSEESGRLERPDYLTYYRLTEFRNHLYIINLDNGKISSAEMILTEDLQLKWGRYAPGELSDEESP